MIITFVIIFAITYLIGAGIITFIKLILGHKSPMSLMEIKMNEREVTEIKKGKETLKGCDLGPSFFKYSDGSKKIKIAKRGTSEYNEIWESITRRHIKSF